MRLLLQSGLLLDPVVPLIVCKSLAFLERPAGRSVNPVPSSGLLDLRTCYLDSRQHDFGTPNYTTLILVIFYIVLASIKPCFGLEDHSGLLVHLPEQPRMCWKSPPHFRPFLSCFDLSTFVTSYTLYFWIVVTLRSFGSGTNVHFPLRTFVLAGYLLEATTTLALLNTNRPGQRLTWILDIGPERLRSPI
jgi:hypothetical protein